MTFVDARDGSGVQISVTLGTPTRDLEHFTPPKTIWSPGGYGHDGSPKQNNVFSTGPGVSQRLHAAPGCHAAQWGVSIQSIDNKTPNSLFIDSVLGPITDSAQELKLANLRSELFIADTVERNSAGSNTDTSSPENEPNTQIIQFDGRSGMPQEVTSQPWRIPEFMKRNTDCPETLVQSCIAIQLVIKAKIKSVADRTVDAGAIEEVVGCLHRHKSHAKLQETGLWICWLLAAARKEYRSRLIAAGATGVVITAMQTHASVAGVQEQGLWSIYWLTFDCPSNKARVESLGGCELIQRAYATHAPHHKSIANFAPVCLACLQNKNPTNLYPRS